MKTIVKISFNAYKTPGVVDAILGAAQCGNDVAKTEEYTIDNFFDKGTGTYVNLTLDNDDERVAKVLALAALYKIEPVVDRRDIYTEDELQAAPLLMLIPWARYCAVVGPRYGTNYDFSSACQRCGTGVRQTSPLLINLEAARRIEKGRIAQSCYGDLLVSDVDAETLAAANLSGLLLWPIIAKMKNGTVVDVRRQQMFIEHVMPALAPSSLIDRKQVCPQCRRGCFTALIDQPFRLVYRRENLANIQDVNLTWEWFGDYPGSPEEALAGRWPEPHVLVTPKVMNLLRGKTKKEAKTQGCDFIPIWIEDEKT